MKYAFMDAVASLHGLRSLDINTNSNTPPFDLETLATVLSLPIRTGEDNDDDDDNDDKEEKLWNDLSSFVQTLSSLRPSINLKIDMSEYDCISVPTPAQMDIPRPYLACAPKDEYGCKAVLNRQLFSPSGTLFDRLERLCISVCCASPLLFDYSDFTPAKFPAMKWLSIIEVESEEAVQKSLLQKWPTVKDLNFHRRGLTLDTVDKFIELNPQLTHLHLNIGPSIGDTDGVFMLERVAGCLPHLTTLYLYGGSSNVVDSDCLVDTRSSNNFTLAPRLFEVLLALPSLREVSFWYCLVMNHRQTAKEGAKVGIRSLTIYITGANNNWSNELVLEMIACLPHLKSCAFYGNDSTRSAIKEKHPHIRL
ncbi:hypothetical protein GQ42DRAFT_162344 [Ramicandelaber brevisporus]|nr:hypothetical protein GQ42DRAFT_162344 [Ramicandelaber brevisporus]